MLDLIDSTDRWSKDILRLWHFPQHTGLPDAGLFAVRLRWRKMCKQPQPFNRRGLEVQKHDANVWFEDIKLYNFDSLINLTLGQTAPKLVALCICLDQTLSHLIAKFPRGAKRDSSLQNARTQTIWLLQCGRPNLFPPVVCGKMLMHKNQQMPGLAFSMLLFTVSQQGIKWCFENAVTCAILGRLRNLQLSLSAAYPTASNPH